MSQKLTREERDREFAKRHAEHMARFRENSDFVIAAEVSAICDGRTCAACIALDGQKFDLDKTPDLPYAKCTCVGIDKLTISVTGMWDFRACFDVKMTSQWALASIYWALRPLSCSASACL